MGPFWAHCDVHPADIADFAEFEAAQNNVGNMAYNARKAKKNRTFVRSFTWLPNLDSNQRPAD